MTTVSERPRNVVLALTISRTEFDTTVVMLFLTLIRFHEIKVHRQKGTFDFFLEIYLFQVAKPASPGCVTGKIRAVVSVEVLESKQGSARCVCLGGHEDLGVGKS